MVMTPYSLYGFHHVFRAIIVHAMFRTQAKLSFMQLSGKGHQSLHALCKNLNLLHAGNL